MIGSTNLSGGGGVGSDELTATAANVLEETTYVGADTDDELAEGTMQHLSNRATITHTAENATKVIEGDAAFTSTNSDGTARAEIRYNGTEGFITPNTLFAVPQGDMATAGGLTAGKLLQGQSAFGIAGTATSDATGTAAQLLNGKILYGKGSKITGTMGDYSGKTSTSNYVSSTFRSATSGYVFASPGSTGYYTTGSYLRIPASNLSAANIKKGVSIMGIIGTFEGWVSNPLYIYNYGSWSNINPSGLTVSKKANKDSYSSMTINSNNILLHSWCGTSGYISSVTARLNGVVNLTNYSKLNARVNLTATGSDASPKFYIGVNNSSTDTFPSSNAVATIKGEQIATLNISSFSGNYYVFVEGLADDRTTADIYVYQIYLT